MEKEKFEMCKECPIKSNNKVFGFGSLNAKICIIGDAPDSVEENIKKPFMGDAGNLLSKLLAQAGINKLECFLTNIVACKPKGNNLTPPAQAIKCCKPRLNEELSKLKDLKIILALGNIPTKYFLGVSKNVTSAEGVPFKYNNYIVVPTYHPRDLLKDPSKTSAVLKTLNRVKEWLEKDPFIWDFSEYKLLFDYNSILHYLDLLNSYNEWTCDIETSGVELNSVIYTIAFSTGDLTFGFPFRRPDSSMYWSEDEMKKIIEKLRILFSNKAKKIFHNAQFDLLFLKKEFGIECNNFYFDTCVFAHLLDENSLKYGLKSLVWKYLGKGGYNTEYESLTDDRRPVNVSTEVVLKYNCADAHATYLLYKEMLKMSNQNLLKLHHKLNIPCIEMLVDVRLRGVKIDVDYIIKLKEQYNKDLEDICNKIYEISNLKFNIDSTKELTNVLFNHLKLPVMFKTEKGNPSTDTDTLVKLSNLHPIIPLLIEYRKKNKLINTYFENFLENRDINNRLHTEFLLTGTVTGRLASKNPNLQNIPRFKEIKDIFIAEKGYFLAEFDFKQIELRLVCFYSKDENLKKEFYSDIDVFKKIGSEIYNVSPDEIDDEKRRLIKSVIYGLLYGRSANSIALECNISVDEAKKLVESFLRKYPKVKRWFKEVVINAKTYGYLINFFGRMRRFIGITSSDKLVVMKQERQAINFLPQSTAADYTLFKASLIYPLIKKYDAHLVLTVHDSLVYEIPEEKSIEVLKIIFDILSKPIKNLDIEIPFDCAIGYRLGSLVEINSLEEVNDVLNKLKESN